MKEISKEKNSSKVIKITCVFENLYQGHTQVPKLASINFRGILWVLKHVISILLPTPGGKTINTEKKYSLKHYKSLVTSHVTLK